MHMVTGVYPWADGYIIEVKSFNHKYIERQIDVNLKFFVKDEPVIFYTYEWKDGFIIIYKMTVKDAHNNCFEVEYEAISDLIPQEQFH